MYYKIIHKMKAAYFKEHGDSDKIIVGQLDIPEIKPNEILIKVEYCGLNRLDLFVRQGSPALKIPLPHVSGSDIFGKIDKIGENVKTVIKGERVVVNAGVSCESCETCQNGEQSLCNNFYIIGEHVWGGLAEFVAVPERNCYKVSDEIDPLTVVPMILTGFTAWRMLSSKANLRPGQLVLIPGSGGGLSSTAIQIAKYLGATVIAVTSTKPKEAAANLLGADFVLNYKENPAWGKEVMKLTQKRGVDVVFESVGAATWEQSLRSLKIGGTLVTAGATSGYKGVTNIALVFWKQLNIIGSTMANRREFEEVMTLILNGTIKPVVDKVFSLDNIKEAQDYLQSGKHIGKIMIKVS